MNDYKYWITMIIFLIMFFSLACFGIYSDYQFKMKRLDLIEKGVIKG